MLSTKNYVCEPWNDYFDIKNGYGVNFDEIPIYGEWKKYFGRWRETGKFKTLENELTQDIKKNINIFPYPQYVFKAFNDVKLDDIKVVILGQDPYRNSQVVRKRIIPEAMGLSFSVPIGIDIPPSLINIYQNQLKNKIIPELPKHGNLEYWVNQGCLMMNAGLTVREGDKYAYYCKYWQLITDGIIKLISKELDNVVFVLWGNFALEKLKCIDMDKHEVVCSSHPSPMSFNKKASGFPSFEENNHFAQINNYLLSKDKDPIDWKLLI